MNITVPIYQRKKGTVLEWTTLGLGAFTRTRRGAQQAKLHQQLVDELRKAVETAKPADLVAFDLKKGTALRRVPREVLLRNVAVALGNTGDARAIPALMALLKERAPLIRAHAVWALGVLATTGHEEALDVLRQHVDEALLVRDELALARA